MVSNSPNTYANINTYLIIYRPVDLLRSILTVDADLLTREHSRYRLSMKIHLRRITVDCQSSINDRDNFLIDSIDNLCGAMPKYCVIAVPDFLQASCAHLLLVGISTLMTCHETLHEGESQRTLRGVHGGLSGKSTSSKDLWRDKPQFCHSMLSCITLYLLDAVDPYNITVSSSSPYIAKGRYSGT